MAIEPAFGVFPKDNKWHCTNSEETFDTREEAWDKALNQYRRDLNRPTITVVKKEESEDE